MMLVGLIYCFNLIM